MADEQVPVLIVGGSLVGLTASALLASQGVPHMLIERHRGTAIHPRAASFHQRTMEIFRSIGLQREVEEAAAREFIQNGAIISVDTLSGKELAAFYRSWNDGVEGLSPASRLFITQVGLEPILRARADELGATHLFSTELADIAQDADGIIARIRTRDGSAERDVRARYMIAADGTHSFVRQKLGIPMAGRGRLADCMTIYFRADMRAMIGDRALSVVYVNNPQLVAFFRFAITGDAGFLAVFATFDEEGRRDTHASDDMNSENCAVLVRTALGVDRDFPVEIENVQPWTAMASTAASFRQGNIFLAGDAAHVMPPTGGFGGNTGVADVHNLAWKLAMVIKGEAGEALLDSYEAERRPIGELTVEQAYSRYVLRVDPSLGKENIAPPLDDPAIELGAIYRSAAIIGDDTAAAVVEDPHNPSGRPGTRISHVELRRGGATISIHDLAGPGFTLLAGSDGEGWVEAGAAAGLQALRVGGGGDLFDPSGTFERVTAIEPGGAILLRPDGVIGWRATGPGADRREELDRAIQRICGSVG
jgi:2-polyprenyl-6-methoxyphenol hydroxylase-like FAD-dependent oxidoreductase